MTYKQNITAILECYFAGFKEEIIDSACNRILEQKLEQEPKTDWITVSEGLPEDGELVLFSTKTDRVFEGRYFADNTDCQWYAFRDECFAWNNVVIAWMPLPTLPKPYKPQGSEISETDTLDKIKGYVDHIRNTGMGKKKSLEFIEKFIEGLKAESEG